ncbi:MAG: phosphoenolpyruvate hydrolase family protein [Chloroflexi bacterium]|nr:phosphoenolpyruvate hydrolase family protein [Chloroflexota bacterium]
MRQFTRKEILERLRAKVEKREPIIIGGAGIGLVAKAADRAGIDIIGVYNTGPFRMDGHGSLSGYLAYGDSNAITLRLGRQVLKVVASTPVIAGIGAADPYRDIDLLITEMMNMGFSGITNVPTAGVYDGTFRRHIDDAGLGYPEEVKLIRKCHDRDIFTVGYAFTPDECGKMAEAGADIIGTHVGLTTGGLIGAQKAPGLDEACERTEEMCQAALKVRSDVILVGHGGPFEDPQSVRVLFEKTSVHGYLGASSIERIPVEKVIIGVIAEYKALQLKEG